MYSWENNVEEIKNNLIIKNYFTENEISLKTFLYDYIDINEVITMKNHKSIDNNKVYNELSEIKKYLKESKLTQNENENGIVTKNNINNEYNEDPFLSTDKLVSAFPDSEVTVKDTCNIEIKKDLKPTILIDSKQYHSSNIPKVDVDNFYNNCKTNDCCGILCNAVGGIANRSNFEIDIQDGRILVFLCSHNFDYTHFQLAVRIIYNIYDIIKEINVDDIVINKQLFQRLKIEYDFFIKSFNDQIFNLKTNINSLEKLALAQIDNFFKRTNFNTDLKPFPCQICGTGCSSDKALKRHLNEKHLESYTQKRVNKKVEVHSPTLNFE